MSKMMEDASNNMCFTYEELITSMINISFIIRCKSIYFITRLIMVKKKNGFRIFFVQMLHVNCHIIKSIYIVCAYLLSWGNKCRLRRKIPLGVEDSSEEYVISFNTSQLLLLFNLISGISPILLIILIHCIFYLRKTKWLSHAIVTGKQDSTCSSRRQITTEKDDSSTDSFHISHSDYIFPRKQRHVWLSMNFHGILFFFYLFSW